MAAWKGSVRGSGQKFGHSEDVPFQKEIRRSEKSKRRERGIG